jgi:hypothetical protein
VVDWRTNVAQKAAIVGGTAGVFTDWQALADRWRAG